jgi:hypothetical protein
MVSGYYVLISYIRILHSTTLLSGRQVRVPQRNPPLFSQPMTPRRYQCHDRGDDGRGGKKRGILFAPEDALEEDPVVLNYLRNYVEKIEILKENG